VTGQKESGLHIMGGENNEWFYGISYDDDKYLYLSGGAWSNSIKMIGGFQEKKKWKKGCFNSKI
jgi:hypothetical protein